MISTDRLLLQKQIYNFLRSVTIKYDPIAQYLNLNVIKRGYAVNEYDPTSWKYYINMVGDYHVSDTPMYVTSLDTQQEILFDKDILTSHPRTRAAYLPGGAYYERLCKIHPEQVDLIKSILFPVEDIAKAITAPDLTLLQYGSGYLEEYEEPPLVEALHKFLEIVKERWYFDFLDDEPLFYLTFWGILWPHLGGFLMTERESYIHTPYVHNWHVWNKLMSEGMDDYSDILDRQKSMMLYRNIDYLKANAGKMSNLIILADRLLHDFGISIYARRVVQEAETGAGQYQLTPQLQPVRIPTNTAAISVEIASETVQNIQNRAYAKGFAISNTAEDAAAKERQLGDTTLNMFMTKFLEIRPITKNKIYADSLNLFLLETLTTSIVRGYYRDPVLINDIATGATLYLYPKELLALYHYATLKSIGLTPQNIPTQFLFTESFTTEIGTPAKTIMLGEEKIYIANQVNAAAFLADLEYNTYIDTPSLFTEMLTRQWLRYMDHLLDDQDTKLEQRHYVLQYLHSMCHSNRVEEHILIPGFATYEQWLGVDGLDIATSVLAQYDVQIDPHLAWGNLADSIMTAFVPMNDTLRYFGNFTPSDFGYERLRQLFVQMCSYRVVFLESSRALPQFLRSGKWSSYYGPEIFHGSMERLILRSRDMADITTTPQLRTLHPGFCDVKVTKTSNALDNSVTTSTNIRQTTMVQGGEQTKFVKFGKMSSATMGTIELVRTGLYPTGMIVESPNAFLIDEDGSPLIDLDGEYILDPNSPDDI